MLAIGVATGDPSEIAEPVLTCWDLFLAAASVADLAAPSRLPGWTGRDVCIHLGSWPDHRVVDALQESARATMRSGRADDAPHSADETNARVLLAHRSATDADALAALRTARAEVAAFFASPSAHELGRVQASSALGPLPLITLLHAACYELAVHALDLAPYQAGPVPPYLLDRGLAALLDVTGALAFRSSVHLTLTAQTPSGGWRFASDHSGWSTEPVEPGPFRGTGVKGSATDLLDTSAGRANLGQLLLTRRLQVQELASFMRLAPLLHEVPGLPGGAALRTAVAGLGSVTKVLGRFRRA